MTETSLLDELLKVQDVDSIFVHLVEKVEPRAFSTKSGLGIKEKQKLLEDLKEEVENKVVPILRDSENLERLDEWLRDNLLDNVGFLYASKKPYKVRLGWENNKLPSRPEDRLLELVNFELFDVLSKRGLQAVKECRNCHRVFIARKRNDQLYCSGACRIAGLRNRRRRESRK